MQTRVDSIRTESYDAQQLDQALKRAHSLRSQAFRAGFRALKNRLAAELDMALACICGAMVSLPRDPDASMGRTTTGVHSNSA